MKSNILEIKEKYFYRRILNQIEADYSNKNFEELLIDKGVQQTTPFLRSFFQWITLLKHNFKRWKKPNFFFLAEALLILAMIFYINNPSSQDDIAASDLIGEFSLETI